MDTFFEIIGYLAGFCISIAFIPQAIKTFKTKDVQGLSRITYSIYNLGILGWIMYGFYIHSIPVTFFNIVSLFFSVPILYMTFKYKKD